jgi:hypothetical protein
VPPSQTSDGVSPPELDGLVMRSLAKEPDDRFQTAEEMRGLVQYGLQMLYDQGGHTGTWNTGPVTAHDGRHTPAAGFAGTTVLPHPGDSGTSQIPQQILPAGYGGGDDGGFEGHGDKGGGRGKLWILAVLAVIAITAGVAFALNKAGNEGGGGSETTPTPSASHSTKDKDSSASPSDEPSDDSTDTGTGTGNNSGSWSPSSTPSQSYSDEPSADPTTPSSEPTKPTPTTKEPTEDPTPSEDPVTPSDPADGGTADGGTTTGVGGG